MDAAVILVHTPGEAVSGKEWPAPGGPFRAIVAVDVSPGQ
jgi:hypothetical protein